MTNNIKIIRRSKGLTQEQVAERLKNVAHATREGESVTRRYIGILEAKRPEELSQTTLSRIAKALRVRIDLLTQDGLKLTMNLEGI